MKYIVYLIIPVLLLSLYGGCGSNGSNSSNQVLLDNLCFLPNSDNPCFDPNIGSETRFIDDMTVEEVIAIEEGKPDFVRQVNFSEIHSTLSRSFFLPPVREGCVWGDDGLVIKTFNDWQDYRNNCYYTDNFVQAPDVNFSEHMIIISLKAPGSFGTEIVAVLQFEDEIVVVLSDTISDAPSFIFNEFASSVAEIMRSDLPVSFIRVTNICNSITNFSTSQCLAQSMLNNCEPLVCSSQLFFVGINNTNCQMIDCTTIGCNSIRVDLRTVTTTSNPGVLTMLELDGSNFPFPMGVFEVEDVDPRFPNMQLFTCGSIVE